MTSLMTSAVVGGAEGRRSVEVTTQQGEVRGHVESVHGGRRVETYLGIPYARPPVGELRFEVSGYVNNMRIEYNRM